MKRRTVVTGLLALPLAAAPAAAQTSAAEQRAVLRTYCDIAAAMYADSVAGAERLKAAVDAFLAAPSEAGLTRAREAWVAARAPYMQTEVFRFGNKEVDEWEGKVNAWPLDEGMIDYVDASYGSASDENPLYTANIIASRSLRVGETAHDLSTITYALLESLHEAGGVEANVTIGYHAIEFLLWGQDLNGTGPGAGNRPFTDYTTAENAQRRAQYLRVVTAALVDELKEMAAAWGERGAIRRRIAGERAAGGIAGILTGLGSLSYGELAGERMKLGLLLHDPEEEHDCFSDNTHNSHWGDVQGMAVIWRGEYRRADGRMVRGASLRNLTEQVDQWLRVEMDQRLAATLTAFGRLKQRAETVERYDQMLGDGNAAGNATIQAAIDALVAQTRTIERIVAALRLPAIQVEGSDSLDNPTRVLQAR